MSQIILKWRKLGPVQADHLAETRRLLKYQQCMPEAHDTLISDAQIHSFLWLSRSLPVVIDALLDARSEIRVHECKWRTARVVRMHERADNGPSWVAATYRPRASRVHVSLFDLETPQAHPRKAWGQIQFDLDLDAARPMDVSIQRFRIP